MREPLVNDDIANDAIEIVELIASGLTISQLTDLLAIHDVTYQAT